MLRRKLRKSIALRKNLTELPTYFMAAKSRKFFSNICAFQRDVTFASYYPKKNEVVVFLSTMHNDTGIESSGEKKLEKKLVL